MKVFYDKFIFFEELEIEVGKLVLNKEEKQETERLIDEITHHRVLERILTHLPRHYHAEFLDRFHHSPYDESLIDYLNEKIEKSVEEHVKEETEKIKKEILEDIKTSRKKKV